MKRLSLLSCALFFVLGCSSDETPDSGEGNSTTASAPAGGGNSGANAESGNSSAGNASTDHVAGGNGTNSGATTSGNSNPWGSGATSGNSATAENTAGNASDAENERAFTSAVAHLAKSAQDHVDRGYFESAVQARTEIVQLVSNYYGADSWQAQNAQLALDHTKRVINLTPEQKLTYDEINSHDVAGQTQTRVRNTDAAIGEFRLATTLATQLWGPDSHVVGNLKHKEALVHQSKANYAAAEQLFLQAMDIRRRALGETHPDYSTSINALGVLYHRWGQHEKAERALKDAIANVEVVWGKDNPEYATAINNLGMLYNSMRRFDDAVANLKQVAELRKGPSGEPNALYGHAMFNLGSVYYQAQRFDEALPTLEEALAVLEPAIGRNHDIMLMLLNNLGMSYMSKQRYEESEKLLVEVAATLESRFGSRTLEFAQAQHNIGVLYLNQERFAEAEPYVQKSLDIREIVSGRDSPGLIIPLKDMATILRNTNRAAAADQITARVEALAARQENSTLR